MKAAQAKRKLLDESVRLIDEQGLGGLSFREMARRAGVSHQAPYHHFVNREGILAAIASEGFERLNLCLSAVFERKGRASAQDTLREILHAYMTFAIANRVHYRLMFRPEFVDLRTLPNVRAQALTAFQKLVDAVADCHPEMARADPGQEKIANTLWAAAHGVAVLWLDGPLRRTARGSSIASLIDAASAMFSQAGASAAARRARPRRRK